MTIPMVPSKNLLSSSHSSTFSKQPWNRENLMKCVHFSRKVLLFWCVRWIVSSSSQKIKPFFTLWGTWITRWRVKQVNHPCMTCAPQGQTHSHLGSFRGLSQDGRWGDGLNGGSSCRVVPRLECGRWDDMHDLMRECAAVSSGLDYIQALSAVLSQWTSSVSAHSHFGNSTAAFNPLLWTC